MVTKSEAITILETYFENDHNKDPLYNNKIGVNRINVEENEVCWILCHCQLRDINKEKFDMGIGGGLYYVDKKHGKIYHGGSSILGDYTKDLLYFIKGEKAKFEWKPIENTYLECQISSSNLWDYEYHTENCQIHKKEAFIEQSLSNLKESLSYPIIRYKVKDGIVCGISIGKPVKLGNDSINIISIKMVDGFNGYMDAIWNCKKWLRVNGKKLSDNYWIEVIEENLTKKFDDWDLVFKMEYFNE